jgi:hypothetical protein
MFVIEEGQLLRLFPHSGHYRPGEVHMYFLLHFLDTCGVRLCEVACDAQRLAHVARRLSGFPPPLSLSSLITLLFASSAQRKEARLVRSTRLACGQVTTC